jgi:Zn-dependent peptidase ImmA (M78 family)
MSWYDEADATERERRAALAAPMRRAAEAAAERLLNKHKVLLVPVPVETLVESEGVVLVEIADPRKPEGQFLPSQNTIVVNRHRRRRTRERYTVAHELGHFCLNHHHGDAADSLLRALLDDEVAEGLDPCRPGLPAIEQEANAFASALLMPAASVREAWKGGCTDLRVLADRFDVSAEAMTWRVGRLRLL